MIRKLIVALTALDRRYRPRPPRSNRRIPSSRPRRSVAGDIVRIGDLVENAGIVAQVPIFRAPDLGFSGTVSAEAVARGGAPARADRARHRRRAAKSW